jgi:hypothetical protein
MPGPALLACLLFLISPAAGKAQATETYRLRVANTLYGAVEVSVDEGKTWSLFSRVQKAALGASEGGAFITPSIERASGNGIAFSIGGRRLLKVLPDLPANYKNGSAIVVSNPVSAGIFNELMPPIGASVRLMISKREADLPTDFIPHDGDIFVIRVTQTPAATDKLPELAKKLADRYKEAIANKLRAQGKKPTNGTLTVSVNVATGEKLSALTYYLDGEVVAIQNQPPFQLKLDTRRWPNGEHVLEARAVDNNGAVLTQKKTLLYVENEG